MYLGEGWRVRPHVVLNLYPNQKRHEAKTRITPAEAGYHETCPERKNGAAYTIPNLFYTTCSCLSSSLNQKFTKNPAAFRHMAQKRRGLFGFIGGEADDTFGLTAQNGTELFDGIEGDGAIVLPIVDGAGVDAVFIDEGVGGDAFGFHRFLQRIVADHGPSPFLSDRYFTILKKISIMKEWDRCG